MGVKQDMRINRVSVSTYEGIGQTWGKVGMGKMVSISENRGSSAENGPKHVLGEPADAPRCPTVNDLDAGRAGIPLKTGTSGRYVLQRNRHRRKPLWFSSTDDVRERLSEADLSTPALSKTDKPRLRHEKGTRLIDTESGA